METILKLDDLLEKDTKFELQGRSYTLDTSVAAFIRFLEWNKSVIGKNPEEISLDSQTMLLKIIVKEDDFIDAFNKLNVKNQIIVLKKLVTQWNDDVNLSSQIDIENKKK